MTQGKPIKIYCTEVGRSFLLVQSQLLTYTGVASSYLCHFTRSESIVGIGRSARSLRNSIFLRRLFYSIGLASLSEQQDHLRYYRQSSLSSIDRTR